jgi:hypothetical protein
MDYAMYHPYQAPTEVAVRVRVDPDGPRVALDVPDAVAQQDVLEQCLVNAVQASTLPRPSPGRVTEVVVAVPMHTPPVDPPR